MFSNLYELVVVGKEKAVVAFIVGAVGSFVARHGLTLDMTLKDVLESACYGLIGHGSVYFTRNK